MFLRRVFLFGSLIGVWTFSAPAQQRPGGNGPLPGDPGYGVNSSQSQLPPPPPRPTGQWIKTWGALAGGTNGQAGFSVGGLTKADAERDAVVRCTSDGGQNCRPTFAYYNQCVAVLQAISNPVRDTIQGAQSVEVAEELAAPVCSAENGGGKCAVVYSACTDPIFRRF